MATLRQEITQTKEALDNIKGGNQQNIRLESTNIQAAAQNFEQTTEDDQQLGQTPL